MSRLRATYPYLLCVVIKVPPYNITNITIDIEYNVAITAAPMLDVSWHNYLWIEVSRPYKSDCFFLHMITLRGLFTP